MKDGRELILIDGSPGIGCPVIASLTGADAALIVTEPSVSGLHDLKRIAELCGHFGMQTSVVINKWDIHEGLTKRIEETCRELDIDIVGRLPFDKVFTDAMLAGETVVEFSDGDAAKGIRNIWDKLKGMLRGV